MQLLPPVLRLMLLPVLNVLGPIIIGFSLSMLIPLALSLWKKDGASAGFEIAFCITFFTGLLMWLLTRRYKRELIPRDGFLLVTMAWVFLALAATIPLYVNIEGISFVHAFFEATSGITTTCGTILSGLDRLPLSVNFWRCFLAWMGGIGILVMAVAVLPLLGVGGSQIFRAESSGPMKEGRLTPRIADTAKAFYNIYLAISVACAVCYHFAGMDWDDAIMHTFTTVSLGGYSSQLAGKSRGLGLCGFLIDRRHQLLDALYCLEKTVPEGLPERRRNVRLDRNSGTYFDFCVLHAGLFEDVYECLRRDLLRCDKYGFRDQYRRLCQHQLRRMAACCSAHDFIRVLFCNLRRVHGRRLQDDPSDCLG